MRTHLEHRRDLGGAHETRECRAHRPYVVGRTEGHQPADPQPDRGHEPAGRLSVGLLAEGQPPPGELLVAPIWSQPKAQVVSAIREELRRRGTHQGWLCERAARQGVE